MAKKAQKAAAPVPDLTHLQAPMGITKPEQNNQASLAPALDGLFNADPQGVLQAAAQIQQAPVPAKAAPAADVTSDFPNPFAGVWDTLKNKDKMAEIGKVISALPGMQPRQLGPGPQVNAPTSAGNGAHIDQQGMQALYAALHPTHVPGLIK